MYVFVDGFQTKRLALPKTKNAWTMKTLRPALRLLATVLLPLLPLSCDAFLPPRENGKIELSFQEDYYLQTRGASPALPDTNQFLLKVADAKGNTLYEGLYGAAPQTLLAAPGTYSVSVVSAQFDAPAFDAPQYGDMQQVTVQSGQVCRVQLLCRQLNAGVRLRIASAFLTAYPSGSMHLKAAAGKLLYSYSEKRFAYFPPGAVALVLSDGAKDQTLLSRDLAARDMLTLDIDVAAPSSSSGARNGISIQVDTTLNWLSEGYTIGGGSDKGKDPEHALSVSEARSRAGEKGVWVYGYIVGGDLSASKASFSAPFSSRTNLLLAARAGTTDKGVCLSVQLQKGAIRDALNLVDHPERLGTVVRLRGDLVEAYYGIPGLQNLTDYR